MTEERISPLRARMIEDMRFRGRGEKAQKSHIRAIKDFAQFLGHSPDTAIPKELRAYQLHMTDTGVSGITFNVRIVTLGFFFGMTCGREDMKRYMQFSSQPRKLPVVFSVEEVSDILMAAPGPGLKYRAALSISYGAGLRASEVCNFKIGDIVPEARFRHAKGRKDRKIMLSQGLLGHAKLTTTAQYTHFATKTIRDTVSPYEMLAKLQDHAVKRGLEWPGAWVPRTKLEIADIFRNYGPAWRLANAEHVSLTQLKVIPAIEACRTRALGGHMAGCAKCGHHHLSYNSCRNRHCPKCKGPAARDWMAAHAEDLLPVEYFHVVFG